jgi:hypothetical protein
MPARIKHCIQCGAVAEVAKVTRCVTSFRLLQRGSPALRERVRDLTTSYLCLKCVQKLED